MKKFLLFLFLSISINAQTTLQTVDFETAGSGYTITEYSNNFFRTNLAAFRTGLTFSGYQGSYFILANNTDGQTGNTQIPVYVTTNSINISTYSDLTVKILVAGRDGTSGDGGYDSDFNEYLKVQYSYDAGSFTTISQFIPSRIDVRYLTEDENADGTTDGANLSPAFTEFTYNIPSSPGATNLQIRIAVNIDQVSEEIGFDNIRVIAGGILPVELSSFTALPVNNNIQLNWQTATEVNNYGFEIERTTTPGFATPSLIKEGAGGGWEVVGFVEGNGNSNSPKQYSFVDENPPAGNLQYRLKQIDTDGSFEYYSTIAEVNFSITGVEEKQIPTEFTLLQNYPNPFNPSTVISFQLPVFSHVTLKIYDVLGNEVATLVNEEKAPGNYEITFDAGKYNLSSGTYFYRITTGEFTQTKKFLLQK